MSLRVQRAPALPRTAGGFGAVQARLGALAGSVAGLCGLRRYGLAFLLGALAALALPPFNAVPVLLVSFPLLVWLLDGARSGRACFATGWWFGFGHHLAGLYWISNALLVDAASFAWLIPFVACGLPAVLALFVGAVAWLFRRAGGAGAGRILLFAALWTAGEWLRGHLFTGFPWNLLGYVWTASDAMLQAAALFGIYGLSLLTVLAAASPAALAPPAQAARRPAVLWPVALGAALLLAVGVGGGLRLAGAEAGVVDGVRLRIVQANIPQRLKWEPEQRLDIFRRHLELSAQPSPQGPPTHVIWPETAVPFLLADEPAALRAAARVVPPGGALLTGAPRAERGADGELRLWNSLLAVDDAGAVVAVFDKFHLVPFGEYVPFRDWLDIAKITPGAIDFTPGPGPRTLRLPHLPPFSPLICYEVIFPGAVVAPDDRPRWILNVTNDGWYGRSTGPYQHLAIARVRAVEEGLPLVRAANTGISAVVDAYGRVRARLGLDERGVIDADLPAALPPTPYARHGDLALVPMLLLAGGAGWLMRRRD